MAVADGCTPSQPAPTMTLDLGILLALAVRLRGEPGLLLQVPGRERRAEGAGAATRCARRGRCTRSKWFTLGMITATASWGLHVAALALAPMSVIQVVARGAAWCSSRSWPTAVRLRGRPPPVDRPVPDGGGPGAARHDAAGDARRALALLPGGDDLLRGRPVRDRRPVDHGPADGRPGRAPRRDARRGLGNPLRRLRHGDQGADRHHRRARPDRPRAEPVAGRRGARPRSSPSSPRPAACRTARRSR